MPTEPVSKQVVTVDADGHVLEPRDTWQRYLEPGLRERAIRIERDHEGIEVLLVDGRPHLGLRGRLGALGGIGMDSADLMTVGQRSYEDGCPPGGYDPHARLAVMDQEQIDVALLYPTIGIAWEGLVRDPQLATAYCRAYNRWIVDFCSTDRRRLVPIAHICLMDPDGRGRGGRAGAEGRLRRRLPVAGSGRRAAAGSSTIRASRRSGRRCRTSTCRSRSTSSRGPTACSRPGSVRRTTIRSAGSSSRSRSSPST